LNEWRRLSGRPRRDGDRAVRGGWIDVVAVYDVYYKDDVRPVSEGLAALPERQRQVMAWLYDGYSPPEIAEHLGMKPASVRSNIRHARKTLVRVLALGEEG
jgi:RNA polymerase sigma-70 factor (ECF subfamily)